MSEVMCLAEDEGQTIYYQDTDSLHINSEAVPPLAEAFQRRYGRELVGKEMGQFHVDFDLPGAAGDIYARESLCLGKSSPAGRGSARALPTPPRRQSHRLRPHMRRASLRLQV